MSEDSEDLRRFSLDVATKITTEQWGYLHEAQRVYDYVVRGGEFKKRDDYEEKQRLEMWENSKKWRAIVGRLGACDTAQIAAIWDIVKDVWWVSDEPDPGAIFLAPSNGDRKPEDPSPSTAECLNQSLPSSPTVEGGE